MQKLDLFFTQLALIGTGIGFSFTSCSKENEDIFEPVAPIVEHEEEKEEEPVKEEPKPVEIVYNWVDLDLPSGLKWADRNIGSISESDPGLYFAWGDTKGHEKNSGYDFSSANYSAKGLNSISANLTLAQDAANVNMGEQWRMPTLDDFQELISCTHINWKTINGITGWKFSCKNDPRRWIFLPAAGFYNKTDIMYEGSRGLYWSSNLLMESFVLSSDFNPSSYGTNISEGYYGRSVRGVLCQDTEKQEQ